MSGNTKLTMRCAAFLSNRKLCFNVGEDTENTAKIASLRMNRRNEKSPKRVKNESSPERMKYESSLKRLKNESSPKRAKNEGSSKSYQEYIAANNHSTPVRQNASTNDTEEPSDFDYFADPITAMSTQVSNEVAWDWQNTPNRTPKSKNRKQSIQAETPKRPRPSQRERNSDSPLLCFQRKVKSLKKTMDKESTANLQIAAEMQALGEKVKNTKHDQHNLDDCIKEPTVVNMSNNKDAKLSVTEDKENNMEININKKSSSYDDLFDNSVDDLMMDRCTQEVEEKLYLFEAKGSSSVHLQTDIKQEELSPMSDTDTKASHINNAATNISSIQSKESSVTATTKSVVYGSTSSNNIKRTNSSSTLRASDENALKMSDSSASKTNSYSVRINSDGTLKTYSKLPLQRNTYSSSSLISTWKDQDLHKLCLNNNMVHSDIEKPHKDQKPLKNKVAELFDMDDSFDDCLATCVEDNNLLSSSSSSKFNNFLYPKSNINYKNLTDAPLKEEENFYNSMMSKPPSKVDTPTTTSLNNRKFFKSKSLSEQYQNLNYRSKARPSTPHSSTRHALNSTVSRRTNVTTVSTSTGDTSENSAISLTSSTDRTLGSYVNRSAVKESGSRLVKYNSTGNMIDDNQKSMKTSTLPARCTKMEIERKRLQAKMRLEARQKLHAQNLKNNINR